MAKLNTLNIGRKYTEYRKKKIGDKGFYSYSVGYVMMLSVDMDNKAWEDRFKMYMPTFHPSILGTKEAQSQIY